MTYIVHVFNPNNSQSAYRTLFVNDAMPYLTLRSSGYKVSIVSPQLALKRGWVV